MLLFGEYLSYFPHSIIASIPPPVVRSTKTDDELSLAMKDVDVLLQRGNKEDAANLAADSELWAHALLIAGFIKDKEIYKNIVKRYTR
jgi:hypothetical protein